MLFSLKFKAEVERVTHSLPIFDGSSSNDAMDASGLPNADLGSFSQLTNVPFPSNTRFDLVHSYYFHLEVLNIIHQCPRRT